MNRTVLCAKTASPAVTTVGLVTIAVLSMAVFLGLFLPVAGISEAASPNDVRSVTSQLICQCGCTMVTSECQCSWAEQARADIGAKLDDGMSPRDILLSYVDLYGETVLAAPTKSGFNLTAWITPFALIFLGGILIYVALRRWVDAGVFGNDPGQVIAAEIGEDEIKRYESRIEEEMKRYI